MWLRSMWRQWNRAALPEALSIIWWANAVRHTFKGFRNRMHVSNSLFVLLLVFVFKKVDDGQKLWNVPKSPNCALPHQKHWDVVVQIFSTFRRPCNILTQSCHIITCALRKKTLRRSCFLQCHYCSKALALHHGKKQNKIQFGRKKSLKIGQ